MPQENKAIQQLDDVGEEAPSLNGRVDKAWWYEEALVKLEKALDQFEIPWGELQISDKQAVNEESAALQERLGRLSYYMVQVGRERARVDSRLYLAKSALDHVVQKQLAEGEEKGTVAARAALIVSKSSRLKQAKIDVMEGEALKRLLDSTADSLQTLWNTTSRILTARLREPVE